MLGDKKMLGLLWFGLLTITTPPSSVVADDWIYNPDTGHYYALMGPDTWDGVEGLAVKAGGHLVTVDDESEQLWLEMQWPESAFPDLWIGLNREDASAPWEWVAGEPVTYTNWCTTQPSDYELWVGMNFPLEEHVGCWNDYHGTLSYLGIVETTFCRVDIDCDDGDDCTADICDAGSPEADD